MNVIRSGTLALAAWMMVGLALARAAAAGEKVEDFTLPRVTEGKAFRLKEAKGEFVALHFLLKTECPVCLRHTHQYLERAAELKGVRQVFVKPDSAEDIAKWSRDMPKGAPIFRDAEAALAKRFKIPDGYAFHGQTVHFPALVLIDPSGNEVFRYVGKNNGDRFDFDKLAAKVAEMRKAQGKASPKWSLAPPEAKARGATAQIPR